MNGRKFVTLLADLWRSLLWCGLIGTALGLVFAIVNVLRGSVTEGSTPGFDIGGGALAGAFMGVIMLGLPACAWTFGRWLLVKPAPSFATNPASSGVAQEASHGAMVGSAAAIPGAFAGGVAGLLLVVGFFAVVMFISLMTGNSWWTDLLNSSPLLWLAGFTIGGALLGALTGMMLGGAIGAIFGGVRAVTRPHS